MKIQTLRDIRLCLSGELRGLYPEEEINSLASIIIKTLPGIKKLHQIYNSGQVISSNESERIKSIISQLKKGIPIQYITGTTVFFNYVIKVNKATLIPRQETEELVDIIIRENKDFSGRIIDFGTGSGCIAIALAKNLPGSTVIGTDISEEALVVARENALENEVEVDFLQDDIFYPDRMLEVKTGIIVSNPPYIRISEKAFMNRNVLEHEPAIALFVNDSEPLIYYRAILRIAEKILQPGGKIYFEINEALGREMLDLLEEFNYAGCKLIRDLNGRDRIIEGKRNG
ncbi:MAG TPA: peptide chain release factor N(5)-glutamine methyltransferase [Bacteroidales bacterium]|nr:peptide chain release factor N(5)-glutamine methyltransferase [Bacteroidales bacterium]